jgi:hypothetical protein
LVVIDARHRLWSFTGATPMTLVTPAERPPEERPVLDVRRTCYVQRLEITFGGQVDVRARIDRGALNAAADEAALGRFDRIVDDADFARARFADDADERCQDFRIRRRAERRGTLERTFGLMRTMSSRVNVVRDAADGCDRRPQRRFDRWRPRDSQVRRAGGWRHMKPPSGSRSVRRRGLPRSPSGSRNDSGQFAGAKAA